MTRDKPERPTSQPIARHPAKTANRASVYTRTAQPPRGRPGGLVAGIQRDYAAAENRRLSARATPIATRPASGTTRRPPESGSEPPADGDPGVLGVPGVPAACAAGVHCAVSSSAPTRTVPDTVWGTPGRRTAAGSVIDGSLIVTPVIDAAAERVRPCWSVFSTGVPIAIVGAVNETPATLSSTDESVSVTLPRVLVSAPSGRASPSTCTEPTETSALAVGLCAATADETTFKEPRLASGSSLLRTVSGTLSTRA